MAHPMTAVPHPVRVLVTGAGGFIGAALVQRLASLGKEVTAVSRTPGRLDAASSTYRFYSCDLRLPEQISAVIEQTQPQQVYHLAAHADAAESGQQVQAAIQHNIVGLANLLEAMRPLPGVSLVYGDSAKVYGNGNVPYRSEQALEPLSSYGVSKEAGWRLIDLYRRVHGLQAMGLRPTLVYGPGQGFNLFTYLINAVQAAQTEILLDGGTQTRDPLYIDDLIDVLVAAGKNVHRLSGLNLPVGGNREMSVQEIARITVELLGGRQEVVVRPGSVRPTETLRSWCDNSEVTRHLGWTPRTRFEDGVLKTAFHLIGTARPNAASLALSPQEEV
jgi:UDP-glucose 4-epimerase